MPVTAGELVQLHPKRIQQGTLSVQRARVGKAVVDDFATHQKYASVEVFGGDSDLHHL